MDVQENNPTIGTEYAESIRALVDARKRAYRLERLIYVCLIAAVVVALVFLTHLIQDAREETATQIKAVRDSATAAFVMLSNNSELMKAVIDKAQSEILDNVGKVRIAEARDFKSATDTLRTVGRALDTTIFNQTRNYYDRATLDQREKTLRSEAQNTYATWVAVQKWVGPEGSRISSVESRASESLQLATTDSARIKGLTDDLTTNYVKTTDLTTKIDNAKVEVSTALLDTLKKRDYLRHPDAPKPGLGK